MKQIRQPIVTVCGHVDHGKCVSGDTIIPLVDGTLLTAKNLFEKYYNIKKAKKKRGDIIQEVNNLFLLSNHESRILPTKVSHIWKREAQELIEIKTAHGDVLKTTPEHPYFKYNYEGDNTTPAENLKKGDFIAIPKKIKTEEKNPKKLLIQKLKKTNFLCFLNQKAFELIKEINEEGVAKLSKELGIKHLRDSLKKERIRIRDLSKIAERMQMSDLELYEIISTIKSSTEKQRAGHTSKRIKLPDFHDPEKLGYILGCIAGDGHLSKTQVLLDNNDKELHERFSEYVKEIFDIDCKVKQNHTCKTVLNNGGLTFKKFMTELIGFPDQKKSATVSIPMIAQTNKEVFKGFFAGIIDTDGYISHINYSIELTSKSKDLIKKSSILLLNFGIQSTVYTKKGFYYLRISNKEYLRKFLDNFHLRLTRKLKRVINAYERSQSSRIFGILPIPKQEIKNLILPSKPNKTIPYFNKYLKNQNITKEFLRKVLSKTTRENQTSHKLRSLLESEVDYVKVVSKKRIKNTEKYVYDFTIPKTHNFVAERTIVHNTSILDTLRGSSIQESEKGGITQKISFTLYPSNQIRASCYLIDKTGIKLHIPGFLFIDTPGHAAFTNLRKRGGSLADLAVLVIDINEGIKPQTAEVIKILKHNKTPFIIALNKIDNISGWRTPEGTVPLKENIESQARNVQDTFNERYLTLIGSLNSHGFDADLFYNITDFSKKIALIPTSARTKEGIPELTMMLCGLSQKYLEKGLEIKKDAKGIILEVKKEKAMNYAESILYDGELSRNDTIAISDLNGEPIISKIRILEEIKPLSTKFQAKEHVIASTGLRIQLTAKEDILPGMPFLIYKNNDKEIKAIFKKEIEQNIKTQKKGIIAKADSLGSLEALLTLLEQSNIPVVKAGIGNINKSDVISAKANLDINELDAVIVGFNVKTNPDVEKTTQIKILTEEVVYKLIENVVAFRKEKQQEVEKRRLMQLSTIGKAKILHEYVFRNTNPAIFGVRIEKGKLKSQLKVSDENDENIGKIKNIQSENKSVDEATEGMEVAISIPGVNVERQLKDVNYLYSEITESQFRTFKKNKDLLSQTEIQVLQEIAELKRKKSPEWGM